MNEHRKLILKEGITKTGPIVYWMQRDQRAHDNWALLYAQKQALKKSVDLYVVFNLITNFLDSGMRQYDFMLDGLKEVENELSKYNIHFQVLCGNPIKELPQYLNDVDASLLVADFNPLKIVRQWKDGISRKIKIPFHEIDAHNIVPCFIASGKLEYAAYTIRPKIQKLLPEFLEEIPSLKKMKKSESFAQKTEWLKIRDELKINNRISKAGGFVPSDMAAKKKLEEFTESIFINKDPLYSKLKMQISSQLPLNQHFHNNSGEKAAISTIKYFIKNKFANYNLLRNNPNAQMTSELSPYLHFGQISAQRVALMIQPFIEYPESHKSFLEELIIRRELADNFCYYNPNYDSFEGFPDWAKATLNKHRKDRRKYVYSVSQFEHSETHDDLWNSAQNEMVRTGKMHGYLRMYWAKKILEWSSSPEEAMKTAIFLNDRYELDGRDPNGYAGIAWSIGGVHDRAWFERDVYGKIRYMNYNGCSKKFDVKQYITTWR